MLDLTDFHVIDDKALDRSGDEAFLDCIIRRETSRARDPGYSAATR